MNATPTRSDTDLHELRAGVLRRPGLVGPPLRDALSELYDRWLRTIFEVWPEQTGVALVAVGGLGRREPAPYSDLDLVLLHNGKVARVGELADSLWYPIWDSKIGLDHSVRTVDQAVAVAKDDLKALLGLLDVRHIAGDPALSGQLRERVLDLWRVGALKRFPELAELSRERWALTGEAAFLLEPNVKDSRGGLRDGQLLRALALAQLIDLTVGVREAYTSLLDVRGELHRRTEHDADVLRLQEHDGVALALGLRGSDGEPDRDALLRRVNEAARSIGLSLDVAWRRVGTAARTTRRPGLLRRGRGAAGPERVGLAEGVVAQDGEVVLAREADPWADHGLVLRAARAAAENDLPLAPFALERLASEAAPVPEPWPAAVRSDFVSLLGAGRPAIHVLESLDEAGLLARLVPEWDAVRCKAQHNPVHVYTVDRHLLETAAQSASLARQAPRPDLLLVGAFLHDIGKGYPGDHSVVGAERAAPIAARMGFDPDDVEMIVALVRHHLLLPDTAMRRDLDDPATIRIVTDAVERSPDLLAMLHALTIADAAATGPAAWSDWKAGLIAALVARTRDVLGGAVLPAVVPLDPERRAMAESGQLEVRMKGDEVLVAVPDELGVLHRTAGVLALHSLNVRAASIRTHAGMAVNAFVVEPRFGKLPDPVLVREDLARAMAGTLPLTERLREKERAYGRAEEAERRPPTIAWFDDEATDATVVEFRGDDAIGLLYRITATLEQCEVDVRSARISSLGGAVVDAFYVTTRDGAPVPAAVRPAIEATLLTL